ncbi:hypothetical protein [Allocoleopsis sp.]|uniref:hypothetical protein n=1 Tax=Allocoleopsis sp. TaxID=3088169 RepID=UPI002FD4F984
MRVWITSVLVVFGMVELYQWMKNFTLPLPVFIVAGAVLAIASNYGKYSGWSFQSPSTQSDPKLVQTALRDEFTKASNGSKLNPSSTKQLPQATREISFTIRRTPEAVKNEQSSRI